MTISFAKGGEKPIEPWKQSTQAEDRLLDSEFYNFVLHCWPEASYIETEKEKKI